MGIYTKFDVGDTVYVLFDNGVCEFKICKITANVNRHEHISINYTVKTQDAQQVYLSENDCFESTEEVVAHLLQNVKKGLV